MGNETRFIALNLLGEVSSCIVWAGTHPDPSVSYHITRRSSMSIFDVWLESWTMTDLAIFGAAGLVVVLVVFVRPLFARRSSTEE
jgi:hypothetical protein